MPIDPIISQAATILNNVVHQATGQTALAPITDAQSWVSVAQTLVKNGYEPALNALTQMWGRTIFSIRDYRSKLRGMDMDAERWGNATRKVSPVDADVEDDQRFTYPMGYDATKDPANGNGQSVDHWTIHKPDVQQTVFYGQSVFQDVITIFKDQLDSAFRGPEEFVRFNAMVMQNRSNKLEQYEENGRRLLLANMIAAINAEGSATRVRHLLTEYNTATGLSLTRADVLKPENYAPFVRWVYAELSTLARLMSNRSNMFQTVIGGKVINRHTPADQLMVYISGKHLDQINSMAKSTTYHDSYLENANWEGVDYWQAIQDPTSVNMAPSYVGAAGTPITGTAQSVTNIFGIMFDRDAAGMTRVKQWSATTTLNVLGGYWNDAFHVNHRTRFDMTEKAVLLLLD